MNCNQLIVLANFYRGGELPHHPCNQTDLKWLFQAGYLQETSLGESLRRDLNRNPTGHVAAEFEISDKGTSFIDAALQKSLNTPDFEVALVAKDEVEGMLYLVNNAVRPPNAKPWDNTGIMRIAAHGSQEGQKDYAEAWFKFFNISSKEST